MDESVKRRERLKAMRSEASSSQVGDGVPLHDIGNSASSPPPLCNPLLNPTSTRDSDSNSNSNSSSRFDYYTDPLSAFSSTKRSKQDSQISFAPSPRPSPPYTPPPSGPPYPPNFGMPQIRGPFYPPPQQQYGIPPGMRSPYQGGNPGYHHGPTNPVRGINSFNPYPVQGRGPWHNRVPFSGNGHRGNRPFQNMGRGQGRYGNFVRPGAGRGGWTGPRNQSAEVAPGLYFEKSSVEDPWKLLIPIAWKGGKGLIMESPRISMVKKTETTSKWSGAGPSLAELLAESFKEAAADDKETFLD